MSHLHGWVRKDLYKMSVEAGQLVVDYKARRSFLGTGLFEEGRKPEGAYSPMEVSYL